MKRIGMFVLLSLTGLAAFAADPAVVTLHPDFGDLLPGAKYHVEVRPEYVVFTPDVEQHGGVDAAQMTFPSSDVAAFDFLGGQTVPANAPVLRLPARVPVPPAGLRLMIGFKVRLQITPAAGSGIAPIVHDAEYTMAPRSGAVTRCLQIRGPRASGGYFIGVGDCDKPLPVFPRSAR